MGIDSARSFIQRLQTDDDFLKQVKECKNSDERINFVRSEGFNFTTKEINSLKGEFTDDDLRRTIFSESMMHYDSSAGHGGE